MSFDDLIGRRAALTVRRRSPHGAYLARDGAGADAPVILLPRREVPDDLEPGASLDVFVTLDSEDRPVATLVAPRLTLGEVAFLTVTDLTAFGAFFDWGLPKELLVSKREQTRDVVRGERHPIALIVDRSGPTPRLAGTMRITERLAPRPPTALAVGDWVDGEAWRRDATIGTFVIVARAWVGLVPVSEPHRLERGEAARLRVAAILPDGKVVLSLRAAAHTHIEDDGAIVLAALSRPSPPRLGDHSDPDDIRALLGLSKKAFKRAVGGLLKRGAVVIDGDGHVTVAAPPRR
ncbi:MAG: nucleic acid-binding protein [Deltaproteobacteria bacterium]|nr:nucleic acid-binding protein [Deltaproteobacteria bacterium]